MTQPVDVLEISSAIQKAFDDSANVGFDEYDFLCGIGLWLDLSVRDGTLSYSKVLQMTLFLQQQLMSR